MSSRYLSFLRRLVRATKYTTMRTRRILALAPHEPLLPRPAGTGAQEAPRERGHHASGGALPAGGIHPRGTAAAESATSRATSALRRERATRAGPITGDERAKLVGGGVAPPEFEEEIVNKAAVVRLPRRGEDSLRRAPSLPGARSQKDAFYDWLAGGLGPIAAELEEACAIHPARLAWVKHQRVT